MKKSNCLSRKLQSTTQGRTRIDDHPLAAGAIFLVCLLPTGVYHLAFGKNGFNASGLPWKISLSIQVFVPAVLLTHYLMNRKRCRLWCEGVVATCGLFAMWIPLGSWSFFYFLFAPMPSLERGAALTICFGGTAIWLSRVWSDYKKIDRDRDLKRTLFNYENKTIAYSSTKSDGVVLALPQRNSFTRAHRCIVSFFGLFFGVIVLITVKIIPQTSGPHALFLIISFLSFPLSQWVLGYLCIKTIYFHVYLPLQIERETGKKVILAP